MVKIHLLPSEHSIDTDEFRQDDIKLIRSLFEDCKYVEDSVEDSISIVRFKVLVCAW